jgi:hypothetical protein
LTDVRLFHKILLYLVRHYYLCDKVEKLVALLGKGLVKFSIVVNNCSMFFSSRDVTETVKVWWWMLISSLAIVPAIYFASSASRESSGAIRKNLFLAFGFKVIPTKPPETFIERLICSSAWSALLKCPE